MYDDPDARTGADALHLEHCPECTALYKVVSDHARTIGDLLAVPAANLDVAAAFERVRSAPAANPRFGFRLPVSRPGSRPVVLALAAAVGVTGLLATVIARDLSTAYQPTSVTPVPVTVADMQALSQLSEYGTITWTTPPQPQVVTNAADASTAADGMQLPKVSNLPAGISTNVTYAAMSKAVAVFTFSADKASAAAASHGKTLPRLPAGMDGAQLTVTVGPAVVEIFGNFQEASGSDLTQTNLPQLIVVKSSTPTASSTTVTVKQLEDYLLAQPGISTGLADAIKAIGDPATTLPIPLPVEFTTSAKVPVQGVEGLAVGDNTGVGAGVIWVKDDHVYAVAGQIKQSDAIDIANNLK